AMRSIDHLSEHDRLQFLGDYYGAEGELDRSIALLQELIAKWPADSIAAGNLALMFADKRDLVHALELGEPIAHEHPRALHPRVNLEVFEVLAGKLEDAERDAHTIASDFAHAPEETYVYLAAAEHLLGKEPAANDALTGLASINASQATTARADLAVA